MARGARRCRRIALLGEVGPFPLLVLFGLNAVDELDRGAFSTLAPEIRDSLGASDATMVSVATVASALAVLLAVPLGFAADRWHRGRIVVLGAGLWGLGSVVTGLATGMPSLATARFAAGAGRLVNDTVHPSLLSDYYPAKALPNVTALHRLATEVGAILAGPTAGVLAALVGWRAAFLFLTVPTLALTVVASRLHDPAVVRTAGGTARARVGFAAGFGTLYRLRTLRRIWAVAFLFGAAALPLGVSLLSLFFDREYGVGPTGRGLIQAVVGVAGVVALLLAQWWARRARAVEHPERLMAQMASFVGLFGAAVVVLASVPSLPLGVTATFCLGIGAIGYMPSYFTLVALITPGTVRSQAYGYSLFFFALGGLLFSQIVAWVIAIHAVRPATLLLGVSGVLAAVLASTRKGLVAADVRSAAGV